LGKLFLYAIVSLVRSVQLGHKKFGGRKKSTPNKRTIVRREVLERAYEAVMTELPEQARNMTPLEALPLCMHWAIAAHDRNGILAAAAAAAPYCHARLASADVRVTNRQYCLSDEELEAEIAERRIAAAA
jgi:hypothetical protein